MSYFQVILTVGRLSRLNPSQDLDRPSGESSAANQNTVRGDPFARARLEKHGGLFGQESGSIIQPVPATELTADQLEDLHELINASKVKSGFFEFRSSDSMKIRESVLDSVLQLEPGTVVASACGRHIMKCLSICVCNR